MEKEFYITLIIQLHMTENGEKINYKEKVLSITRKLFSWSNLLIIEIGKKLMNIGSSMKDLSNQMLKME